MGVRSTTALLLPFRRLGSSRGKRVVFELRNDRPSLVVYLDRDVSVCIPCRRSNLRGWSVHAVSGRNGGLYSAFADDEEVVDAENPFLVRSAVASFLGPGVITSNR